MNIFGMPIYKSNFPMPKLMLSSKVEVSDSFRKEYNDWLRERFGIQNVAFKVKSDIFGESIIADSLTYDKILKAYEKIKQLDSKQNGKLTLGGLF